RSPVATARVERGSLADMVSVDGILTFRGTADGSPFTVTKQARATYTELPGAGDKVGCGDVLYRVDERPVLLLCGPVPAYRALREGDAGADVRQLNRNLGIAGDVFTAGTQRALETLQRERGLDATGA